MSNETAVEVKAKQPDLNLQRIVCAAIRNKKTGLIICGPRHFDETMVKVIESYDEGLFKWADADQGFVDQYGNFLTRHEAYIIAERKHQLFGRGAPHNAGVLFSEDLY